MNMYDEAVADALNRHVPLRTGESGNWERVVDAAIGFPSPTGTRSTGAQYPRPVTFRRLRGSRSRVVAALFAAAVVLAIPLIAVGATQGWFSKSGATVPDQVLFAVHGRTVGWAKSGNQWFVIYLQGEGKGICGLDGAHWRMALVATTPLPAHIVDDRSIGGAMCGNQLSWVRAGRFSDGKHQEVAFMLWTTPSIGAMTYLYRIHGRRIVPLAQFAGDDVVLGPGSATVTYENSGRSPHGELKDIYSFQNDRYRLVATN
jgi:hypothetical protein